MKKQTAVDWFFDELQRMQYFIGNDMLQAYKQAKAMEKEQIIEAREDGHLSTYAEYGSTPKCYLDGGHEQYYTETYEQ